MRGLKRHTDLMRSLHGLLAGVGFLMGLIVVGIASWAQPSEPVRINYGYTGDEDPLQNVSIVGNSASPYLLVLGPLVGALLGWLCAVVATRLGWKLSRSK